MIDAFLGILIATFTSIALLTSISVSNKSLKGFGRHPLTNSEKELIKSAGYKSEDIKIIEMDIRYYKLK